MGNDCGPLSFSEAKEWFTQKFGQSCEVREWHEMKQWEDRYSQVVTASNPHGTIPKNLENIKKFVNPHWSWSNGTNDLRVYIAGEKELAFFYLSVGDGNT